MNLEMACLSAGPVGSTAHAAVPRMSAAQRTAELSRRPETGHRATSGGLVLPEGCPDVPRPPGERHDLAHALAADAAHADEVGVVPYLATVKHVLEVNREGDHLHNPWVADQAGPDHTAGFGIIGP
jgi:hypothetical protein